MQNPSPNSSKRKSTEEQISKQQNQQNDSFVSMSSEQIQPGPQYEDSIDQQENKVQFVEVTEVELDEENKQERPARNSQYFSNQLIKQVSIGQQVETQQIKGVVLQNQRINNQLKQQAVQIKIDIQQKNKSDKNQVKQQIKHIKIQQGPAKASLQQRELVHANKQLAIQSNLTKQLKKNEHGITRPRLTAQCAPQFDCQRQQTTFRSKSQYVKPIHQPVQINFQFPRSMINQTYINADLLVYQGKDISQSLMFDQGKQIFKQKTLPQIAQSQQQQVAQDKIIDKVIKQKQRQVDQAIQPFLQKPLGQLTKATQKPVEVSNESGIQYLQQNQQNQQEQDQDTSSPYFRRRIPEKIKGLYYQTVIQKTSKIQRQKVRQKQKSGLKDIYSLQLPELKGKISYYTKDSSKFTNSSFIANYIQFYLVDKCSFMIKNIEKIKILKNSKGLMEIKISYFGIDIKKLIKMNKKNVDASQNHDQKDNEVIHFLFQVNNYQDTFRLFSGLIVRKFLLSNFLVNEPFSSTEKGKTAKFERIQGQIYKSSRILHSWQKKKVVLDEELKIYKKENKISFNMKSISQLWTRFDMHNGHFVIKVWSGAQKIEFGIPILNYTNVEHPQNWLYGFYKILIK